MRHDSARGGHRHREPGLRRRHGERRRRDVHGEVTIPTALNLVGAGAGMTIIKAPATLATPNIDIVAIQAGATVLMSGFTVSGPLVNAGCGTLGAGIDVLPDATATIHDNTIAELRHEPLDGAARRWSRSRDV